MSESREWCHVPNCDSPDEQIGFCDFCGKHVCEHHAIILGENGWKCFDCAVIQPESKSPIGGVLIVAATFALGMIFYWSDLSPIWRRP